MRNLTCKLIALLLTLQIILMGIQAKNRIQNGESQIEVFIWMLNNCISLLQQVKDDEEDD
ncbi:MAG: hypothetical protein KI793_21925 [Rivularia sp. (in: Bacteria)]|nr:hypothetical protein [Rivularia sp. MS3]